MKMKRAIISLVLVSFFIITSCLLNDTMEAQFVDESTETESSKGTIVVAAKENGGNAVAVAVPVVSNGARVKKSSENADNTLGSALSIANLQAKLTPTPIPTPFPTPELKIKILKDWWWWDHPWPILLLKEGYVISDPPNELSNPAQSLIQEGNSLGVDSLISSNTNKLKVQNQTQILSH